MQIKLQSYYLVFDLFITSVVKKIVNSDMNLLSLLSGLADPHK